MTYLYFHMKKNKKSRNICRNYHRVEETKRDFNFL